MIYLIYSFMIIVSRFICGVILLLIYIHILICIDLFSSLGDRSPQIKA